MTEPLAAGISAQASDTNFRVGQITAVSGGVATVSVQGGVVTNAGWLQTYNPIVGDNVLIAVNGQSWIVIGSIGNVSAIGAIGKMLTFAQRSAVKTGITTESGVLLSRTAAKANHRYLIMTGGLTIASSVNEAAQVAAAFRSTSDGSTPTTASLLTMQSLITTQAGTGGGSCVLVGIWGPLTFDHTISLLLTCRRIVGAGTLALSDSSGSAPNYGVWDLGVTVPNTGIDQ